MTSKANKVKYFDHNTIGTDYVVGDLHGCYLQLNILLSHIDFDGKIDRLFSVGDLVDRGEYSRICLEMMYLPWFHPVRGNHEQMMIDSYSDDKSKNYSGVYDNWMYNGGEWCLSEDTEELKVLAKDADNMLPLVIVIGKGTDNRINIVHAEIYKDKNDELATDEDIDDWYFHDYQEENMIWGRTILQNKIIYKSRDINNKALSTTYVGHTPTDIPQEVISHRFIDTAACYFHRNGYEKAKLTMVRLNDSQVFSYNMKTQVIDEFKFK